MSRMSGLVVIGIFLTAVPVIPLRAGSPSQPTRVAADPNERVCEDTVVIGSRLAKKRFCGTRAEWEARKKADREVIEDAQRHAADPCHAIQTHTGPATC